MSIFKEVIGADFTQLHPMLQKRYDLSEGNIFKASGIMNEIKGGPKWLYFLFQAGVKRKLLFPEHGKAIPFSITNQASVSADGQREVHWERIFHFGGKRRYFNALMSFDPDRRVIQDYLGEPPLFYSDLAFTVTDEGSLTIESLGQRLVLGKIEIPLPKLFHGLATVSEKYNEEKKVYEIAVTVKNPLIGVVFAYEGMFVPDENT